MAANSFNPDAGGVEASLRRQRSAPAGDDDEPAGGGWFRRKLSELRDRGGKLEPLAAGYSLRGTALIRDADASQIAKIKSDGSIHARDTRKLNEEDIRAMLVAGAARHGVDQLHIYGPRQFRDRAQAILNREIESISLEADRINERARAREPGRATPERSAQEHEPRSSSEKQSERPRPTPEKERNALQNQRATGVLENMSERTAQPLNPGDERYQRAGALNREHGRYSGKVVQVSGRTLVQDVGRKNHMRHRIADLDRVPLAGERVTIQYRDGRGTVQSRERGRGKEL